MFSFFGCNKCNRYKIIGAEFFENVKSGYKEGETVEIYDTLFITDVSVYYYVDGKPINPIYKEGKGVVITFVMPDHDVEITTELVDTMDYHP